MIYACACKGTLCLEMGTINSPECKEDLYPHCILLFEKEIIF